MIYGVGYIFVLVYSSAPLPWIISVDNFRFFTNILETFSRTYIYYISLEMSFHSASSHFCCKIIEAEMAEKWQVND